MPDYTGGRIYKIVNDVDDEIYVGATVTSLSLRLAKHRSTSKIHPTRKLYAHVETVGGWHHFQIVLVEDCPCERKEQLTARERYYVEQMGTLNKRVPGRTDTESHAAYREANFEQIKAKKKTYYEANRETINAINATYRDAHPEKIKAINKAYRETNREKLKAQHQAYVEANYDKLKAYKRAYHARSKEEECKCEA